MQAQHLESVSQMDADVHAFVTEQRAYFDAGHTRSIDFRISQLKNLKRCILKNQDMLVEALQKDLNKPLFEAYAAEIGFVINELNETIRDVRKWAKPKRVYPNLLNLPSMGSIQSEPLGLALIIAPWNYPFQLAIAPLIGALAAGNCAILKASEIAVHTSAALKQLLEEAFETRYVRLVEGGVDISQCLLAQRFDHIFFTGSTAVGRIVMQAAAKNLTPVTLELGGKSPCIVEADAPLELTCRRIAFGKWLNAGQTCIAPDYLLVHSSVKDAFVNTMKKTIDEFYGTDTKESPDYCRIISERHYQRLASFLNEEKILHGGQCDPEQRFIAPTLMHNVSLDEPLMQEEIFGPILPILTYETLDEAIELINSRPKPLALYLFSNQKTVQNKVLSKTSSGGVTINDTLLHMSMPGLPFGGVGESGLGSYHGQTTFDIFSHKKSIMYRPTWGDVPFRYAPYTDKALAIIKKSFGVS